MKGISLKQLAEKYLDMHLKKLMTWKTWVHKYAWLFLWSIGEVDYYRLLKRFSVLLPKWNSDYFHGTGARLLLYAHFPGDRWSTYTVSPWDSEYAKTSETSPVDTNAKFLLNETFSTMRFASLLSREYS